MADRAPPFAYDGLDRVFHEKARLGIVTSLAAHADGLSFTDLKALCGGCCTCSTCHVWVEGGFFDRLPPMSDQEADLLALADHRRTNSRLGCQIRLSDTLDGIGVAFPPQA